MKILKVVLCGLLLSCSPLLAFADSAAGCAQQPTFTPKLDDATALKLFNSLPKTEQAKIANDQATLTDPSEAHLTLTATYEADLGNNGQPIVIFVSKKEFKKQPNYHQIIVNYYTKTAQGLDYLGGPATGYTASYNATYKDPITHQDEFIVTLCGKTYVDFLCQTCHFAYHDVRTLQRKKYLDRVLNDKVWTDYQRYCFQKLYNQKLYTDAYFQLEGFLSNNESNLDKQTTLWIKNDLALDVLKNGNPLWAEKILQEITQDPAFANSTTALKKSIAFNKALCQTQLQNFALEPAGKNQFSWLLNPSLTKTWIEPHLTRISDQSAQQLQDFILQVTPFVSNNLRNIQIKRPSTRLTPFAYRIYSIFSSGASNLNITDHRYVILTALYTSFKYGDLIWVDTQQGTSVVVSYAPYSDDNGDYYPNKSRLDIASKNFDSNNIPQPAKQALRQLINNDPNVVINFFEINKDQATSLPRSWLQ